jgi:hypothetical protein
MAIPRCAATTSIECFGAQRGVRSSLTPLDCDPNSGFLGDPLQNDTGCLDALNGQSGHACQAPLTCGRRGDSSRCCVELARCSADSVLTRYRLCPEMCAALRTGPSVSIASCEQLAQAQRASVVPVGETLESYWLGQPCAGDFVCSSMLDAGNAASPGPASLLFGVAYFCANGALQLAPVLLLER